MSRDRETEQRERADGGEQAVPREEHPEPEAIDQPRTEHTSQQASDALRERDETGHERRIAEHLLAVEAQHQYLARHPRAEQTAERVADDERVMTKDPQRHQRLSTSTLDEDERAEQDRAHQNASDERQRGPTVVRAERRCVHQDGRPGRHERGARKIEMARAGRGGACGQRPRSDQGERETHRHVHEEHASPADGVDQDAAGNEPDDETGRRRHAEVAEDAVACRAFGIARRQGRQRGRRNQRGGDALDRA